MDVLLARQLNLISFLLSARGPATANALAPDGPRATAPGGAEADAYGARRAAKRAARGRLLGGHMFARVRSRLRPCHPRPPPPPRL